MLRYISNEEASKMRAGEWRRKTSTELLSALLRALRSSLASIMQEVEVKMQAFSFTVMTNPGNVRLSVIEMNIEMNTVLTFALCEFLWTSEEREL